jgi:hypothetical protein
MAVPSTTFNSQIFDANRQLAEKIVADKDSVGRYVSVICLSDDFYKNPYAHLFNEMIQRNVGGARGDDGARRFVISKIPGFIEKVKDLDYWKSFALEYFKENSELGEILNVFNNSIKKPEFKEQLKQTFSCFEQKDYYFAEKELRKALTIFLLSKNLKSYTYLEDGSMEE